MNKPDVSEIKPIGLHAERLLPNCTNEREVAFVQQWQLENSWHDLLPTLFRVPCDKSDSDAVEHTTMFGSFKLPLGEPTERDRIVAETIIQWLGSNCGLSFVHEALRRVDYGIRYPYEKR